MLVIGSIGALAARIIEYRTANGPFTSVEQLTQVKGIGDKLLEIPELDRFKASVYVRQRDACCNRLACGQESPGVASGRAPPPPSTRPSDSSIK